MNLIISFSGRKNGNCDQIAEYIASDTDRVVYFRELNVHDCSGCGYECFRSFCRYHEDDAASLYESMLDCERTYFIVPMYCGNPPSLYFKFHERGQDFFMHHESCYEALASRLFIIGVYGDREKTPDFIPCLAQWFDGLECRGHVLGIERHPYGQKLEDSILNADGVKAGIDRFIGRQEGEIRRMHNA